MKGDVVIVEDHHHRVAAEIAGRLHAAVVARNRRTTIAVAGESGSGKSETGQALQEAFVALGLPTLVLGQDDYFRLPPKSNDTRRRQGIDWVGPGEVDLELLDQHLAAVRSGTSELTKPMVFYAEDRIGDEALALDGVRLVVAEGTYTALLKNIDHRVFIDRDRLETMEARRRRGREAPDPFLEDVLDIEHWIISEHRNRADVVITRDYAVRWSDSSQHS